MHNGSGRFLGLSAAWSAVLVACRPKTGRCRPSRAIVGEHDVRDQTTLANVKMPNRNGFTSDPRPDIPIKK